MIAETYHAHLRRLVDGHASRLIGLEPQVRKLLLQLMDEIEGQDELLAKRRDKAWNAAMEQADIAFLDERRSS